MYTLNDVPVGESVTVVKLYAEGAMKRRILDMGITRHCKIYVRKVAPLGDPIEINLRGYELSLRKADAALIEVQAVERLDLRSFTVHETEEACSCH